jgi:DNA-binding transcriptional ArsR family regulator
MKKIIALSTKEELNIYMSPQRQQLLRAMHLNGMPMTAKMLAGRLGISASSASHHISKLIQLKLIEEDHTEVINGITAKYFRLADVTVSIGIQKDDGLFDEKNALLQNLLQNTLNGLIRGKEYARSIGISQDDMKNLGDCISGVVHLKPEDARALLELIRKFTDEHEAYSEGTEPWEYSVIFYKSGFES